MLKILLIGKNGQLGWELQRTLATLGALYTADYPEVDLSKPASLRSLLHELRPQVIVNAAAYTAVDRAESEPALAQAINAQAPGALAEEACQLGAALIHYSTDYVFDGAKGSDYVESDPPNPLGVYAQSKLDGESAVCATSGAYLILRTSWVYSLRRDSFVTKVLQWARQNPILHIVDDQIGNPTWARMLAEITAQLLAQAGKDPHASLYAQRGIYHLAGGGRASRMEWAQKILEYDTCKNEHSVQEILPAKTQDFPTPAQRPLHSALNCDKFIQTFALTLPDWRVALRLAMERDC